MLALCSYASVLRAIRLKPIRPFSFSCTPSTRRDEKTLGQDSQIVGVELHVTQVFNCHIAHVLNHDGFGQPLMSFEVRWNLPP